MADHTASAAEQMDRIYRHQRFIYDLTRRYYLLGRDQLIGDLLPPRGACVLEIGCGTGRNLIVAARRYPDAHFLGIDVSSAMLDTARQNIARAQLSGRIAIALGDATAFDPRKHFGVSKLDRVFCSYVLSMIPRWPEVIENAVELLATDGAMHMVDFGDFGRCPQAFAAAMHGWLRRFHVHPIHQLEDRLVILARQHGLLLQSSAPFRRYAVYARLKRSQANAALARTPEHRRHVAAMSV